MMPVAYSLALNLTMIILASDQVLLERPIEVHSDADVLQYDDGTPYWLNWSGLYRGVWLDINDFGLSGPWTAGSTELWFYHHTSYPWDTSSFYCQLCQGDQSCPTDLLDQTSIIALHYQPVYAIYDPVIEVGDEEFWVLINTELSAGGWPSVLGDGFPNTVSHSFFSNDYIFWEPWIAGGSTVNDYFIRASNTYWWPGLETRTWGSIKTFF